MPSKANLFIAILLAILGINFCRAIWLRPQSEYADFAQNSRSKQVFLATVKSDQQKSGYRTTFEVLPDGHQQLLQVSEYKAVSAAYGDRILIAGAIKQPKASGGSFDYADYLAGQNIRGEIDNPQIYVLSEPHEFPDILIRQALDIKQKLYYQIAAAFKFRPAGLLIALMFGDKHSMLKADQDNFNSIGAAHMIAVSGFKLTLLLIWLDLLRRWLSRKPLLTAAVLIIFFYLSLSGFAAAVLRAAIMNTVYVFAKYSGRKYSILPALLLTAAILASLNPLILLFDIGFLLSFGGILGIIFFGKPLSRALNFIKWRRLHYLKEIFVSGLAAQLATAPLIALFFQQFNPYAPFINMLVVPLLIPSIISGYLVLLPFIGLPISWICAAILNFLLWFAEICAKLPAASVNVQINWKLVLLLYAFELAAYGLIRYLKNRRASDKIYS